MTNKAQRTVKMSNDKAQMSNQKDKGQMTVDLVFGFRGIIDA